METLTTPNYLKQNFDYWQSEYATKHPDTNLVKLFHHIIKNEIDMNGRPLKVLDYGCSNGTNAKFFADMGMEAFGVDINRLAIAKASKDAAKWPMGSSLNFVSISPEVDEKDLFFQGDFDIILSWHTLCYFSDTDQHARLLSLRNNLRPGGLFIATMISKETHSYRISKPAEDGLRLMPIVERLKDLHGKEHFANHCGDASDVIRRLSMFEPMHLGHVNECFSVTNGENLHFWIFVGKKK
jgi:SAM-dependent methyltransferase